MGVETLNQRTEQLEPTSGKRPATSTHTRNTSSAEKDRGEHQGEFKNHPIEH